MNNHPNLKQRCRVSIDALDLCAEPVARYEAADRTEQAGYRTIAEQLRCKARTIIGVHLDEQAMIEGRR
jgi:hypothetical protein